MLHRIFWEMTLVQFNLSTLENLVEQILIFILVISKVLHTNFKM